MPYDGEFAAYRPIYRIAESQRVKGLLTRSKHLAGSPIVHSPFATPIPECTNALPRLILAIDGSYTEVDVKTGYPGARVGYCSCP